MCHIIEQEMVTFISGWKNIEIFYNESKEEVMLHVVGGGCMF